MKRLLVSIFVLCGLSVVSNAQTAGKLWVGGDLSFQTSKQDSLDRVYSYRIGPEIGYQLSDSWGVGLGIGYSYSESASSRDDYMYKDKSKTLFANPFVRYSFLKGSMGCLFVDGGVSYYKSKIIDGDKDRYYSRGDVKADGFSVGLRPGVKVNLSDKISLTAKLGFLGYSYYKSAYEGGAHYKSSESKNSSFGCSLNLNSLSFGVIFIL